MNIPLPTDELGKYGYDLLWTLRSAVTSKTKSLNDYRGRIERESKELLFILRKTAERCADFEIANFILKVEKEQIARRSSSYRDIPYEELPIMGDKGDKRLYLTGQEVYGRKRAELLIDNDYVLTDDEGRYIYTDEVLTREYLIGLTQEQIQNSKNPTHIFLPIPRAEAIHWNLKAIKDRNNIGCTHTKEKGGRK